MKTLKYQVRYLNEKSMFLGWREQMVISMTQLLSHTFAHLTGSSFRLKAKLLPIKNILGVKYN